MSSRYPRLTAAAASVAVALALLALWSLASGRKWVSPAALPTPWATLESLLAGLRHGELAGLAAATAQRMAAGWALASLGGVVLGAAIGLSAALRAWLQPALEAIRPLPAAAVAPVAIALMGFTPGMVLAVITFGALWPVLLGTAHGFAAIEPRLHEVGRMLRLSPLAFVFKIGLPAALPDVLSGMRLSLTLALILAIVGEMLSSQPGLGLALLHAARSFRAAESFAAVALVAGLGLVANGLLMLVEQRALKPRRQG